MREKARTGNIAARSAVQTSKKRKHSRSTPGTASKWPAASQKEPLCFTAALKAALKVALKKRRENKERLERDSKKLGKCCEAVSVAVPKDDAASHSRQPKPLPAISASDVNSKLERSTVSVGTRQPGLDSKHKSAAALRHARVRQELNDMLEKIRPRHDRSHSAKRLKVIDQHAKPPLRPSLPRSKQSHPACGLKSVAQPPQDRYGVMQAKERPRAGSRISRSGPNQAQGALRISNGNPRTRELDQHLLVDLDKDVGASGEKSRPPVHSEIDRPDSGVIVGQSEGFSSVAQCQPDCETVTFTKQFIDSACNGETHAGSLDDAADGLFFVDLDGDDTLASRDCLYTSRPLPKDQSILGNPYHSQTPPARRHLVSGLELSGEQEALLKLVMSGHNVFYTGSAGSGKSHVSHAFCAELVHEGKRVKKLGPTGMAARNIGGETTYRFAGWTPRIKKRSIRSLENDARTGGRWERLNEVDVIIIDEISMVDSQHFSRLDRICRAARQPQPPLKDDGKRDYDAEVEWSASDPYGGENDRSPHDKRLPFGGIQVIVCGDFFQLPPVKPFTTCFTCGKETQAKDAKNGPWTCRTHGPPLYLDDCWAFKSPAWAQCRFKNVQLKEVHRQADPAFVAALEGLRWGELTTEQLQTLLRCSYRKIGGGISLHATNRAADRVNAAHLAYIKGPPRTYAAVDDFTWNEIDLDHKTKYGARGSGLRINALEDHRFTALLDIKIGMPVMLLVGGSPETRLVNGSQGTVVGFDYYNHDKPYKSLPTVPSPISPDQDEYGEYCAAKIRKWFAKTRPSMLPIVEFSDGQRRLVYPSCELEECGDTSPYTLLSRTQLPLKPAWASTVHKVQGLSLDEVVVDLDPIKTNEMVYVAFSRATSLKALQIKSKDGFSVLKPNGRLGPPNATAKAFMEECFGPPTTHKLDA